MAATESGQRTKGRHVGELGAGGALALLIVSYLPDGWADAFQANLISVVLTGLFSFGAKALSERGINLPLGKLGKIGLVLLSLPILAGCSGFIGTLEPQFHTGADGETIMACEIKGLGGSFGDGALCRETTEGGHLSETGGNVILGVLDAARSIVGGIFGGIGTAVSPSAP